MDKQMDNSDFAAAVETYENSNPVAALQVGDKVLRYLTPNKMCLWRVQTLATKEPDTIAWLDEMPPGSLLLDVGANVGMYSIYAGVVRGARVFAFEPEAQNYAVLCRNITLNGLADRAIAWCAALSDESKFDRIYLSAADVGGSCHSFGESVNVHLKPQAVTLTQGCYATTIDQLIAAGAMDVPAYIKIDVDGFEHKVIKGAAATLRNPAVRSLLIEINRHLPEHMAIVVFLASLGFKHDPQQFQGAQRKDGVFEGFGEYVFRR